MCELFAMSSAQPTKVTFSFDEFRRHGCDTGSHCDGWGVSYLGRSFSETYKEAEPAAFSQQMEKLLRNQPKSRLVISHIRKATQGERSLRNTQPFFFKVNDRQHVFVHNGNLKNIHNERALTQFLPQGETDSEFAFCYLMENLQNLWLQGNPTLEQRVDVIKQTFDYFTGFGPANFIYSDGDYLYAYANKRTQENKKIEPPGLHYLIRTCNNDPQSTHLTGVEVSNGQQSLILFASVPLSQEAWKPFAENQLIVVKQGEIVN